MSLIRWQPLKELDILRHRIDRLFDELAHSDRELTHFPKLENVLWAPAIELKETETGLVLKAVVPGIEAKDLDVQVSENAVSIAGEHREEKHTEKKGYYRSELQYGRFQRTVPLPVSIKHNQVQSEFKEGVLTLTLPKAEPTHQSVTKIDLTTQEKARESVVRQRQHGEHLQETIHVRAAPELETPGNAVAQAEARGTVTEQRQHEEHLQDTIHQRTADNVNSN